MHKAWSLFSAVSVNLNPIYYFFWDSKDPYSERRVSFAVGDCDLAAQHRCPT